MKHSFVYYVSLFALAILAAPVSVGAFGIKYTVSGEFENIRSFRPPSVPDPLGLNGARFLLTMFIDSETLPANSFTIGPQIFAFYFELLNPSELTITGASVPGVDGTYSSSIGTIELRDDFIGTSEDDILLRSTFPSLGPGTTLGFGMKFSSSSFLPGVDPPKPPLFAASDVTIQSFGFSVGPLEDFVGDILDGFASGVPIAVAFADFTIMKAEIKFRAPSSVNDSFEVKGEFTLDVSSDGIDPVTEGVLVTVGTSSVTIPAGSFVEDEGKFEFEGEINGADVEMEIEEINPGTFEFKIEAEGVDLTDTANPLDISLTIGDDTGAATVRMEGKLKFKAQREDEDDDKDKDKDKDDDDDD